MKFKIAKSKLFLTIITPLFLMLVVAQTAFAHVVVKPSEVGAAKFQTFTMGVPVEGDVATTQVRLVVPVGLKHVAPNVKPGWTIDVTKTGEGEEAIVTEIAWRGGRIPVGQRDDFIFSAQAPEMATTLQWKAYQTLADGSVIAWDGAPGGQFDFSVQGPYSETKVVDDLGGKISEVTDAKSLFEMGGENMLAVIALAVSVLALVLNFTHHGKSKR